MTTRTPAAPSSFSRFLRDERGFSMTEAMIGGALVLVALLLLSTQQAKQMQDTASVDLQMQARQALNELLSRVAASPEMFPYAEKGGTGQGIVYVGCLTSDGSPQETIPTGKADFYGTFAVDPKSTASPDPFLDPFRTPTAICPGAVIPQRVTSIEVHLAPDPIEQTFRLAVLLLPHNPLSGSSPAVRLLSTRLAYGMKADTLKPNGLPSDFVGGFCATNNGCGGTAGTYQPQSPLATPPENYYFHL